MQPQENSVTEGLDFSEADRFFKTIGEVSAEIGIPPHVLRFWESKFLNIRPHKRKGGHRYYSKADVGAIYEIKRLLYEEGYTIKGAQKYLKEKGYMQLQESDNQQSLFSEAATEIAIAEKATREEGVIMAELGSLDELPQDKIDVKAIRTLLQELEEIKKTLEK